MGGWRREVGGWRLEVGGKSKNERSGIKPLLNLSGGIELLRLEPGLEPDLVLIGATVAFLFRQCLGHKSYLADMNSLSLWRNRNATVAPIKPDLVAPIRTRSGSNR